MSLGYWEVLVATNCGFLGCNEENTLFHETVSHDISNGYALILSFRTEAKTCSSVGFITFIYTDSRYTSKCKEIKAKRTEMNVEFIDNPNVVEGVSLVMAYCRNEAFMERLRRSGEVGDMALEELAVSPIIRVVLDKISISIYDELVSKGFKLVVSLETRDLFQGGWPDTLPLDGSVSELPPDTMSNSLRLIPGMTEAPQKWSDDDPRLIALKILGDRFSLLIISNSELISKITGSRNWGIVESSFGDEGILIATSGFSRCHLWRKSEEKSSAAAFIVATFESLKTSVLGGTAFIDHNMSAGISIEVRRQSIQLGLECRDIPRGFEVPFCCKTEGQMRTMRSAQELDSLALSIVLFLLIVEPHSFKDEYAVGELLLRTRQSVADACTSGLVLLGESFRSICGFGPNAALPHYTATESSCSQIGEGPLLIDSGGSYWSDDAGEGALTDVTRTIWLGLNPSELFRKRYNQVLEGVALASSIVAPAGQLAAAIDISARSGIWSDCRSFGHGTGHGIGIEIHEFPPFISSSVTENNTMNCNQLYTIEPGYYEEGSFGIRLESVYMNRLVGTHLNVRYLTPEILTFVPFQRSLIDSSCLSKKALDWINSYHRRTRHMLDSLESIGRKAELVPCYDQFKVWVLEQTQNIEVV